MMRQKLSKLISAREPSVLRGEGRPFLDSDSVFRSLYQHGDAYINGTSAYPPWVPAIYLNRLQKTVEIEPMLPAKAHSSFADYYRHVRSLDSNIREFQVYLSDGLHYFDIDMWIKTASLLEHIISEIGIGHRCISLEMFAGFYSQTASGIHLDSSDNFSLIIEGKKTMLFWPEDTYSSRSVKPGGRHAEAGKYVGQQDLKTAIKIDAEPGDIIYWPRSYWHTAVSDGSPCTTANISIWPPPNAAQFVYSLPPFRNLFGYLPDRFFGHPPGGSRITADDVPDEFDFLIRQHLQMLQNDEDLKKSALIQWMGTLTARGFICLPRPLHGATETPEIYVKRPDVPLLYCVMNQSIVVSCCGYTTESPLDGDSAALLGVLGNKAAQIDGSKISGKSTLTLLRWLITHHGLVRQIS